jgi:hypothetical protein
MPEGTPFDAVCTQHIPNVQGVIDTVQKTSKSSE